MQDTLKAIWSNPYVSVTFFPSLKQNFIVYRTSKVSSHPDCIFEIYQLWQSGFSRVYSNCCYSCWFEPEIIKIGQSSHKMYSNNILKSQASMTILNACTKKSGNLLNASRILSSTERRFHCITTPSVTRRVRCLKLRSKPGQLFVSPLTSQQPAIPEWVSSIFYLSVFLFQDIQKIFWCFSPPKYFWGLFPQNLNIQRKILLK